MSTANTSWIDTRAQLLESIDIDCLLNYIDPDWRDHYKTADREIAFDRVTEYMEPEELHQAINESGARPDG